ncbi:MAG TPA: M20/M25/M40 family metallo-hydrolase [Thermoanaerobaculia bacterium]
MTIPPDPTDEQRRKRRHRNERIVAGVLLLTLSALTVAFIFWNRAEKEALRRDRRYIPRQQEITPEILMLQEYVRIDSSNPAGIAEGAEWLAARLRAGGVEPEIIESTPGYLNVYARLPGRTPGEGLLLFNHIDVVPPGEGWDHPPFEGVIKMNQLHGRGVIDMKALAICQLLAFLHVAQSGEPPAHDLVFLATAEEESGSVHGMQWLLRNRPDIFEGLSYGLTEGGVTEMFSERISYFGIEIGGKQRVTVNLDLPDLHSAQKLRVSLEPHITSMEPERVIPGVRSYFQRIAPTRIAFGELLGDVDAAIASGAYWRLPYAYRELTQNTLWVSAATEFGGGAQLTVVMRNLPDEQPDDRIAWLASRAARYGAKVRDVPQREGPVPLSTEETRLFAILTEEASSRYGAPAGPQVLYSSTNDCRLLRSPNFVCYGISPYPVDFFESLSIHNKNERITLDRFMEGVAFLQNVIVAWAAET